MKYASKNLNNETKKLAVQSKMTFNPDPIKKYFK